MTSLVEIQATRSQRLDRLPFTREHSRLLVGSGLGWAWGLPERRGEPPEAGLG